VSKKVQDGARPAWQPAAMASIRKEVTVAAHPDAVWDALRDWRALHRRLAVGFAVDLEVDGGDRVVTFFDGAVARERMIGVDDEQRRLAWSIVEGPYAHHNGAAQVFEAGDGARFVWIADVLPDETAARTEEMMDAGIAAIKRTLEGGP
jgi:Polyketide cyclase / dehydrase and lipid transport